VRIDYIGLGLLSLGLGCLQVVLDQGQTEDWFASRLIVVTTATALICLGAVILWELFYEAPILNLRLLRDRNFAMGILTMFIVGFVLYGSILLLPIFLQQLLGYTATLAGEVLSPGGVITLLMMPLVGALVGRVQARYLLMAGLAIVAYSMFYMAGYNLQIDFWDAVMGRVIQGAGLAFLFVPINVAAFYYIPREKTSDGTALINLVRNVGGGFGIAFTTTLLARRMQTFQNLLVHNLTPLNPVYRHALSGVHAALIDRGANPTQAQVGAENVLYGALRQQAAMLAYDNVFWVLGLLSLVMIPLMLLLRSARQDRGRPPGGH
jgi:DHA2 family multidrug resistance protein